MLLNLLQKTFKKKHARLLTGFTLVLAFIAYASVPSCAQDYLQQVPPPNMMYLTDTVTVKNSNGVEYPFDVELALSPAQQERGLMWRRNMEENKGMLFVFPNMQPRSFWMKNTLIPLDILYVGLDGRILKIYHSAQPKDLTPMPSVLPAKAVLEINGGLSEALEIKEGDQLLHEIFRN